MLLGLVASQIVYAAPPDEASVSFTFSPSSPQVGDIVSFTAATATDPDPGDTLTYTWDFEFDGSFSADPMSGQGVTHIYTGAGLRTVALRVTDTAGEFTTATRAINVTNPPPVNNPPSTPTVSPAGGATTAVRQPVTLTASATDPDGDTISYSWNLAGGTGSTSGQSVSPSWTTAGTKNVTVTANDGRGGTATSDPYPVTVTNTAPTASIGIEPPTPEVGQQVAFFENANDADGDPLTYNWSFGDDSSSTAANPTHTYTDAGTYTVSLTATDPSGASATATRSLMVQLSVPNGSFTTSPSAPLPGQAVTFSSTSTPSTADKSITNVEWDFDYNAASGAFSVDMQGSQVSHSFPTSGVKSVAMRVSEGPNGGFDVVPGTVTVNALPVAAFSLSPARPLVGDAIVLSSTSSDPDNPLSRQEWDLDNDGQFDDATGGVVSRTFPRAGVYTLRLRVTDSLGATSVATQTIRVRRRPLAVLPNVVVDLEGNVFGVYTRVTRLVVNAPRRAKVTVKCVGMKVGRGCPARVIKLSKTRRGLRFRKFERRFRPSMRIVVTTTRTGYIGKHTTFIIRRGVGPLRRSQCITPGAKRPKKCPPA